MHARREELQAGILLDAYRSGFFPMADDREGPIGWYSPDPRAIIPLDRFHVSRSLRRVLRKGNFTIRVDTAFEDVIRECADREETWISEDIIRAYVQLFEQGFGHSVESWKDGVLAGGLYGVAIGGAFFGESMFSRVTDASKVALAALVEILRSGGFSLLDTQFLTSHLQQFGTIEIGRQEYLTLLAKAVLEDVRFPGTLGCAPVHPGITPL